jgi:hypothetical protein
MKIFIAILSVLICSQAWAVGPEECQDKFKDDMQKFYDNVTKGSATKHNFKILDATEMKFPKMEVSKTDDADEAHAKDMMNDSDLSIITTHALVKFKTPPDVALSIKYEVTGTECNEIPNSRQMLNVNNHH